MTSLYLFGMAQVFALGLCGEVCIHGDNHFVFWSCQLDEAFWSCGWGFFVSGKKGAKIYQWPDTLQKYSKYFPCCWCREGCWWTCLVNSFGKYQLYSGASIWTLQKEWPKLPVWIVQITARPTGIIFSDQSPVSQNVLFVRTVLPSISQCPVRRKNRSHFFNIFSCLFFLIFSYQRTSGETTFFPS